VDEERTRAGYDAVAARYTEEIADELPGKPVDRALLGCLAELAAAGVPGRPIGDVGCGPGHVGAYLAERGVTVIGVDLSPGMIGMARQRYPDLTFEVGSMTALPVADAAWAGAVCVYAIIHLGEGQRPGAYAELARVIAPGGWLLMSFHVSDAERPMGAVNHLDRWWDSAVDLDFHFLDPAEVTAGLTAAGFAVMVRTDREPWPGAEYPSRRSYLLARRE
jgi:SAM-dependent methyltransferase